MIRGIQIFKDKLYKALLNGAKAVIKEEKHLNEINVFPVRDADTGSNLRSLMDSIVTRSQIKPTLKETLESISNAALIGSKGNSGLIFSQFIYGLSKDVNEEYIDKETLINQIKKGYEFAYDAIDIPVEGTMITLMRSWYNLLKHNEDENLSFEDYLLKTNEQLLVSLEQTKNQLPILKKHNVVDAGALAFTKFVDGFVHTMLDDDYIVDVVVLDKIDLIEDIDEHDTHDIVYRYCTEILIKSSIEKESLKKILDKHGDSLVIGKSSEYYKIHIHTNEPDKVFEYISKYAKIVDSKVDDMKNQYMLKHSRKHDICILTDSIADIKSSIIDELQIQVLPVSLNVEDTIYFDKRSIKNTRLLELIEDSVVFPSSASPSVVGVKKQLEYLKNLYKHILVITVSSKMSSTHNVFKHAIEQMDSHDIALIDSKHNSVSEGLIVLQAARLIEENKSFSEIVRLTEVFSKQAHILVQVKSLDNMVKSGRIRRSLGIIAKILNLKPVVSIKDGEGIVLTKTIGKRRSIQKMIKHLEKTHQTVGIKSYAICYVNNMREAEKFKSSLVRVLGFMPEYMTESSAVIAMNAGKDAFAVGYITGE